MKTNPLRFIGRAGLAIALLAVPKGITFAAENGSAAETVTADAASAATRTYQADLETLKQMLIEQQRQINELRRALAQKQGTGEIAAPVVAVPVTPELKAKGLGQVATVAPIVPAGPPPIAPQAKGAADSDSAPLNLKIGNVYFTPIGFIDFIGAWRDTSPGSSIGTSFGSFPYRTLGSNTANLSELRFSQQNSRVGGRFDTIFKGYKILAYLEADFLGNNSTNAAVSNGATTMRMRLNYVNISKDKWEVLAGQTWSLLTANRKGISPIPGDLFYSQALDVNYINGMVWGRIPELRFVYHAAPSVTMAFALSQAEQYIGGSSGGPAITLPSALSGPLGSEFNTGASNFAVPNLAPDLIAKIAFDPKTARAFHFEVAGIERTFKSYNTLTGQHFTKIGGGVAANVNVEIAKGVRLLSNNYYSDGGGRYLFGQAPDLVFRPDGSMSLIHTNATNDGVEATIRKTLIYGYYGLSWIGQNSIVDTTGKLVGYGFTGSSNAQNKSVAQFTLGFNQTVWKDAKFGAVNFGGQYAYFTRKPWYVATGTPDHAYMNEVFFNVRYTFPGTAPSLK